MFTEIKRTLLVYVDHICLRYPFLLYMHVIQCNTMKIKSVLDNVQNVSIFTVADHICFRYLHVHVYEIYCQ